MIYVQLLSNITPIDIGEYNELSAADIQEMTAEELIELFIQTQLENGAEFAHL